jgi:small subunit ribosomal protein S26e
MPVSQAPYTRKYHHTQSRGHEQLVLCGYCGKRVPRYKTFVKFRGFRISDPSILQQVDRRHIHMNRQKIYVCPKCARFYKVVKRGKSVRKKHLNR